MDRLTSLLAAVLVAASVGGTRAPDGTEIHVDMPPELQMHNTGGSDGPRGPGSGSGLCVFTSTEHAGIWQGIDSLKGFQKWMTHYPGGGTPDKLAKMIKRRCAELNIPEPVYIQVEGWDPDILKAACKGGRMPCITYAQSPTGRYGGARIAHMVNLVHFDERGNVAILDNNYPCSAKKPNNYEWMDAATFKRVHSMGGAWSVVFFEPGPPPLPRNP
jgi:hypothetical protein